MESTNAPKRIPLCGSCLARWTDRNQRAQSNTRQIKSRAVLQEVWPCFIYSIKKRYSPPSKQNNSQICRAFSIGIYPSLPFTQICWHANLIHLATKITRQPAYHTRVASLEWDARARSGEFVIKHGDFDGCIWWWIFRTSLSNYTQGIHAGRYYQTWGFNMIQSPWKIGSVLVKSGSMSFFLCNLSIFACFGRVSMISRGTHEQQNLTFL